jgi:DegV family protein with EDD domain
MEEHPDRRVFVLDSLSTGPEMRLLLERLRDDVAAEMDFDAICEDVSAYSTQTGLMFVLESMKNLANNGRVSPLVAKLAGILGIRVIGKASDVGTLEQLEKCRGEAKALPAIIDQMVGLGYTGYKVKIAHCLNETAANDLKLLINQKYTTAEIEIYPCRGLCSFYAERGGLLVGFEKALTQ